MVLRTATPFGSLSSDLRGAYIRIAIVGGVILVLVSFLGFILIRRVNEALHVIRNAVREYAAGNLTYRPSVYRPAALKQVADTISALAGDLHIQVAEVSKQRDELEAVFAGMEEAVIVMDVDFAIQEMNDSAYKLAGVRPGDAVGKNLLLVFRNSDIQEIAEQVRTTKNRMERDITLFTDGERCLQVHGSIVPGPGEKVTRIVLVLNDVSRLHDLEQVRRDFVANVSHELKTPITVVKGYVETLLDGAFKDHDTSESFLKIVLEQVDRLSTIVEDLLVISRLEKDTGPVPEMAVFELNELVLRVAGMYEARAKSSGIKLVVTCPTGERLTADRALLEQAISNLVDNALKYSESGGSVEVVVVSGEDTVIIKVCDHGAGIPEEHLERIFERFYRVDKGRSRELGGTGLGLSIANHVATAHGGEISVESIEGEGSTFSLLPPRATFRSN